MSFDLGDYVDVAERERQLFERHPDARVCVDLEEVRDSGGDIVAWKAKATIWRAPDDPRPVYDWAVEPVPGKTPFTKDSEAMNASTSAVGRAIVLAGFETKKIASANEVRNRTDQHHQPATSQAGTSTANGAGPSGEGGNWVWPFGKHKGTSLADTPLDYVQWYADNGTKADVQAFCATFLGLGSDPIPF